MMFTVGLEMEAFDPTWAEGPFAWASDAEVEASANIQASRPSVASA